MTTQQTAGHFECVHEHKHPHSHVDTIPGSKTSLFIQLAFILIALVLVVFYWQSQAFGTLSITFVSIFLEALPFMLLGSLIGGFIEVFVSKDAVTRLLPKATWRSIMIAAGLGLVFPVCECAIVPVVRRLFQKGLPLGAGIAFLLGGPIFNPLVGVSTAVAYGYDWLLAFYRMLLGYLIAVAIGFLVELFFNKRTALTDGTGAHPDPHACSCGRDHAPVHFFGKILSAFQHAANDFLDIGRYLVFGAFIAALLQTVIARAEMAAIAQSPATSVLVMMILAIVLNLCSEADAFVAASFSSTLPLVSQMAFMVLGPMLDIKLVLMYLRIFRKRLIIALSSMTFVMVFLSMMIQLWSSR